MIAIALLSQETLAKTTKKKFRKKSARPHVGLTLRSPDIIPVSLTLPIARRSGLKFFVAPPFPMKKKRKLKPTATEATEISNFTTAGSEADVDILYGFHFGIGWHYRLNRKWYFFNQYSYRETSMAVTGQEPVSFTTESGSLDNIASANIGIDILYQQFTGAIGMERRFFLNRKTFWGFQFGLYLPITTNKNIDSTFSLNRMPADTSLSAVFDESEADRRKFAETEIQSDLALLENPSPIIGMTLGIKISP